LEPRHGIDNAFQLEYLGVALSSSIYLALQQMRTLNDRALHHSESY